MMSRITTFTFGFFVFQIAFGDSTLYPFDKAFTTVEQRKILDTLRNEETNEKGQEIALEETDEKPKLESFTMSGVVIREDGKYMVWVNGKSELSGKDTPTDLKVGKPSERSKKVPISTSQKSRSIKPGQTWIVSSDEIKEGYEFKKREKKPEVNLKTTADSTEADVLKTIKALKAINGQ